MTGVQTCALPISRVVYLPVYFAGIPFLRTGVWAVSVVGMAMMVTGMT